MNLHSLKFTVATAIDGGGGGDDAGLNNYLNNTSNTNTPDNSNNINNPNKINNPNNLENPNSAGMIPPGIPTSSSDFTCGMYKLKANI